VGIGTNLKGLNKPRLNHLNPIDKATIDNLKKILRGTENLGDQTSSLRLSWGKRA